MAPKSVGGAGDRTALAHVEGLRAAGLSEDELRHRLRADGYRPPRISQLLKATRPAAAAAEVHAKEALRDPAAPEGELVDLGIEPTDNDAMDVVDQAAATALTTSDMDAQQQVALVAAGEDSDCADSGQVDTEDEAIEAASVVEAASSCCLPKRAQGPWPNERCAGLQSAGCIFHTTGSGKPARVHPERGETQCLLCNTARCQSVADGVLLALLKKFQEKNADVHLSALARLRELLGDARVAFLTDPWAAHLESRELAATPLKGAARQRYTADMKRDRRVARQKVFFPDKLHSRASEEDEAAEIERVQRAGTVKDIAPNDAGLPAPGENIPHHVEAWCKQGSWGICEKCHSLYPRALQPVDTRRIAKPTVPPAQCSACQKGEYVPQPADIPEPLRGLKPVVLEALRPLEIDTGAAERVPYGYSVHTAMISFAWEPVSVEHKITALVKRKHRTAAEAAYLHLMTSSASVYKSFVLRHEEFLAKNGPHADKKVRKRPLRFLEEEGLECCLWPHLYYHKNLCETVARAAHENRRAQQGRKRRADASSDEEEVDEGAAEWGESNAASSVIGYGADYQLLHFVYDLSLWTTIGTKRNISCRSGVPLRLLLKGSPWTPQYWRVRHLALIDMQRQCGNATLFRTRAPYERTFPYHRWVLREQEILGRDAAHGTRAPAAGQELFLWSHGSRWPLGPHLEGAPAGAEGDGWDQHRGGARHAPGVSGREAKAGQPEVPWPRHHPQPFP